MRKIILLIMLLTSAGKLRAAQDLSLGFYGGMNDPLIQMDTKSGSGFGIKAIYSPVKMIAVGPFFEYRTYRNVYETVFPATQFEQTIKIDGGTVKVIGAQFLIGNNGRGIGPHFYWMAGAGVYKWNRQNYPSFSKTFYHVGPGLEICFTKHIGIEGSAKFEIIPTDRGGSRKNLLAYIGANYHLVL